jgi:hypothetical protein
VTRPTIVPAIDARGVVSATRRASGASRSRSGRASPGCWSGSWDVLFCLRPDLGVGADHHDPGFAWEMPLAVWLIAKGFKPADHCRNRSSLEVEPALSVA